MTKHTLSACLITWIGFGCGLGTAVNAAQEAPLFPIVSEGRVGYIDPTGKVAIPPRFEAGPGVTPETLQFHEGLAAVNEPGGHKGYIDRSGTFVIAPAFSDAARFSEGLAFVHFLTKTGVVDGTGFIDATGKRVIHFPHDSTGKGSVEYGARFSQGLAPVGWQVETVIKVAANSTRIEHTTKWGYVDRTGKLVIPYQFDSADEFSDGLAAVRFSNAAGSNECGYIDLTGRVVFRSAYDRCGPFREGLAPVVQGPEVPTGSPSRPPSPRLGYVDKTGKLVIPLQFTFGEPFVDGLACVGGAGGAAFIDTTGKTVLKGTYVRCGRFSDGLAAVLSKDEKWGYIDRTGKQVILARFDEAEPYSNGLALVVQGPTLSYIDRSGKAVWSGPLPR